MSWSSNQPDACVGSSEMCGDKEYKHFAPVMNKARGFRRNAGEGIRERYELNHSEAGPCSVFAAEKSTICLRRRIVEATKHWKKKFCDFVNFTRTEI